jgi:Chitobiase/beta-hexosaminidase C-terminal domain
MVVISVTVTASEEEVVAGIPRTVSIATNVPASIFYTLDGSVPTLFSTMYTGPIFLSTFKLNVTLNILATNGVESSPIVTECYVTNQVIGTNARLPHSTTTQPVRLSLPNPYPFGANPLGPEGEYLSPADSGITVDNPALPAQPTGFNGFGKPVGFTNQPYNLQNYSIEYSTTNAEGEMGPGIGNLPAKVTVERETPPPEVTNENSNLFDPRAFVIYQDSTTENPDDPAQINRISWSLENPERARDGNYFYNTGLDAPPVSGTFLRPQYNPRTNMLTYYYLDTWTNKWIISTTPYVQTGPYTGNLSGIINQRSAGSKYVFQWLPFTRRVLF